MNERRILLQTLLTIGLCSVAGLVSSAGQFPEYPASEPGDAGYFAADPQLARLVGTPAPSIALRALDGRTFDVVSNYGRKPMYLKLWATYCIACRAQMPGLERIDDAFGDRMQIMAVNAGVADDAAKVRAFRMVHRSTRPSSVSFAVVETLAKRK